ncbi:unnamed protein product [Urochloa decumbens]|uniref:BZIP domain-containing protein n=1 Tax=Urochloa decumbens TaxID=240449 RepID=A0ABC9B446_9POAL
MEANTAAANSPETVDDQALSSTHAQSLLPPLPPPNLTSAFSPAMGDDAFLSVQAHAAASPSFLPEPPPATNLPTLLAGSQPSSSMTSPGLPAFLSGEVPGFAAKLVLLEQLAAWQRETPLVSPPPSGSSSGLRLGLRPAAGEQRRQWRQPPPSPDYELAPLPESLRIPELEEMSAQHNMSSPTTITMGIDSSTSFTPKLSVGAKKKPCSRLLHLPPWDDSADNANKVNFNKHEEEIISKDKSLQDLITTDPKKVKRLIAYRVTSAKRKAVEDARKLELKHQLDSLQTMRDTKYAELQLLQARCAELKAEHNEMSVMVQEMDRQVMLKDGI